MKDSVENTQSTQKEAKSVSALGKATIELTKESGTNVFTSKLSQSIKLQTPQMRSTTNIPYIPLHLRKSVG